MSFPVLNKNNAKGKVRRNERNQFRENINYNQIENTNKETPVKIDKKPSTNNSQRYLKSQGGKFINLCKNYKF